MKENKVASKRGGNIAKKARINLENETDQKVVTANNFLELEKSHEELSEEVE